MKRPPRTLAIRELRIGTRLALGFVVVAGLLLALVVAVAAFGHVQRERLAGEIAANAARDAAVIALKANVLDQADYVRELGMRPGLAAALRDGGEFQRLAAEYGQVVGKLQGLGLGDVEREAVAKLQAAERDLAQAAQDAVAAGEGPAAASAFQSRAAAALRLATAQADRLAESSLEGYKAPVRTFIERGRVATLLVFAVTAVILVLVVLVAWAITRSITRPLREAVGAARRVAAGDLTGQIAAHGRDEAADLLHAMGEMNARLGQMVDRIRHSADSIAAHADQVAVGNEQLAARTEEQASSLEESAATIEQFTATVQQSAGNAGEASAHAEEAARIARDGGAAVRAAVDKMSALAVASGKIREVVGVIDAIAFQTNILALNAAVEAAHAGDQGRGFAVVAAEVRALAQRATVSAKEIGTLVGESVTEIHHSAQLIGRAGATIEDLVVAVGRVSSLMEEVAVAGREQTSGIQQINRAIAQMDGVVQKNAALVTEASAAAHDLNGQAASLVQSVATFRLLARTAPQRALQSFAGTR